MGEASAGVAWGGTTRMSPRRAFPLSRVCRPPGTCVAALLLVGIVLGIYGRTLSYQFLNWDDDIHVTANPHLVPLRGAGLARLWREPYENLYIPVSYSWFAAEAWLSALWHGADAPLDPRVFHAGSLALHAGCVLAVFALLRRLVGRTWPAFLGAALFALHPLQVESVAWISEQRGLLSALLAIVALIGYLPREPTAGDAHRPARYAAATVCFALALLAKPSAVAVPLVAVAIDRGWYRQAWREVARRAAPWLALALVVAVFNKWQQGDARLAFVAPPWSRPLLAGDALAFYLLKLAAPIAASWEFAHLPAGLGFDYGRFPERVLSWPWVGVAWLVPCGVLALVVCSRWRQPWFAAASVFVAGLLPVLGFVPFLYQDISTVADRYLYLPMLGVSLALAHWFVRHPSWPGMLIAGLLLGAWSAASVQQAATWHDSVALYEHGLEVNPQSFVAQYGLGNYYRQRGEWAAAADKYAATLAAHPRYARAYNHLGLLRAGEGQHAAAIECYEQALAIASDFAEAHNGWGNSLAALGQRAAAIEHYRRAIELSPRYADARANLGDALCDEGRWDEAGEQLDAALALRPEFAEAYFMRGRCHALRGPEHWETALADFAAATRHDARLAAAHDAAGEIYLAQHRFTLAQREFAAALDIDPARVDTRIRLGRLLLKMGQPEQGRKELAAALDWLAFDAPARREILAELAEPPRKDPRQ